MDRPTLDPSLLAELRALAPRHGTRLASFVALYLLAAASACWLAATFGENFSRLRALKRKFDPGNLFRMNQNIAPD